MLFTVDDVAVAAETVKTTVLVVPLYAAVTTTQPELPDLTLAVNPVFREPWGTVTLAGT